MKFFSFIPILAMTALLTAIISLFVVFDIYPFGCGGNVVCRTTKDYPPDCNEKGQRFILRKSQGMVFGENPIPDGALYYLQPDWQENVSVYSLSLSPIEVADYNGINLEEFVDKTVCIEGEYRYGLPTFFTEVEKYPDGIGGYEQVVVDIKEIRIME